MHTTTHPTPIGPLTLTATEQGLVSSRFKAQSHPTPPQPCDKAQTWLAQATQELDEYFNKSRNTFTVPTDLTQT